VLWLFELSGGISDAVIDPIYSEILLSASLLHGQEILNNELLDVPEEIEKKYMRFIKIIIRDKI